MNSMSMTLRYGKNSLSWDVRIDDINDNYAMGYLRQITA